MERVVVVGPAGAGKTTVAQRLSARLGVPHIELDAIFWERNCTRLPMPRFERHVEEATRAPGWVVDGNYGETIKAITWSRADTLVWLDPSRATVMRQLLGRTARRLRSGEELFNGNQERPWRDQLSRDPARSILLWSWRTQPAIRSTFHDALESGDHDHLEVHRLRDRRAVARFLDAPPSRS